VNTSAITRRWSHGAAAAGVACWCLLAPLAAASGVPVEAATRAQKQEATKAYKAALAALEEGKNEEALVLLQKSYALVDSPNSRLVMARTLVRLGRYPEAFEELEGVIETASLLAQAQAKYQRTVESATAELTEVKSRVAIVRLRSDGVVKVNDVPLDGDAAARLLVLLPGRTRFRLELASGARVEKELDLQGGQDVEVELHVPAAEVAEPAEPAPQPTERVVVMQDANAISRDTLGYVSVGAGAVGFLGFTIFGIAANSEASTLAEQCVGYSCPESLAAVAERGRSFQTVANVGLGVGIVGVAAATYFFWPRISAGLLEADVAVGPGNVSVRGRF